MNKDFIKEGHYYGYRKDLLMLNGLTWHPVTTYFKVNKVDIIINGENESYRVYGRYLQQYKEYPNSSTLATFSGESNWTITQLDIKEGNIWEISKKDMRETLMNLLINVIENF